MSTGGADLYAVIPAAGSGSRMKQATAKQYIELDGVAILKRTINRLLLIDSIKKIIVVGDSAGFESIDTVLFSESQDPTRLKIDTCIGGASRAESVRNGLLYLKENVTTNAMVLVHDAARPCVRVTDIERLISEVKNSAHGGLLATPVTDTIKRANKEGKVQATVDREALWRAATPQLFSLDLLLSAIDKAIAENVAITDEASAMQYSGYQPKLIECSSDNIKITTATDLVLAQYYLRAQEQ